jgi:hypothetical protein
MMDDVLVNFICCPGCHNSKRCHGLPKNTVVDQNGARRGRPARVGSLCITHANDASFTS